MVNYLKKTTCEKLERSHRTSKKERTELQRSFERASERDRCCIYRAKKMGCTKQYKTEREVL
jgi:hypothetical protein